MGIPLSFSYRDENNSGTDNTAVTPDPSSHFTRRGCSVESFSRGVDMWTPHRISSCVLLLGTLFLACHDATEAAEKPLSQGLQCDGCVAVLQELHKRLSESQGRKRVIDTTLRSLCNTDNFVVYRHSPPKMLKACNFILDNFKDELTTSLQAFYKKYKVRDNLKLQAEFCDTTIKVCLPGQRDADIRMAPEGMSIDEANEKLAEGLHTIEQVSDDMLPPPERKDEL